MINGLMSAFGVKRTFSGRQFLPPRCVTYFTTVNLST